MKFEALSASANGSVVYCPCCRNYRLEFGNIFLKFTDDEFRAFCVNVAQIDIGRWEEYNRFSACRRKVHIQARPTNITMVFSATEIRELQNLLAEAVATVAVQQLGGRLCLWSLN